MVTEDIFRIQSQQREINIVSNANSDYIFVCISFTNTEQAGNDRQEPLERSWGNLEKKENPQLCPEHKEKFVAIKYEQQCVIYS